MGVNIKSGINDVWKNVGRKENKCWNCGAISSNAITDFRVKDLITRPELTLD